MENPIITPQIKKLISILALSILIGVLFDYFFYQKLPGIAFPIYMLIIVGGIAAMTMGFKKQQERANLWLILPIIFFAIMVAVRANPSLTALNIILSFFCLFLLMEGLGGKKISSFLYKDYITGFLVVPLIFLEKACQFFGELFHLKKILPGHKILNQIFKGVLMAIPALLIFIVLFASADAIFNQLIQNIFHLDVNAETFFRTFTVAGVIFVASGIFFLAERGKIEQSSTENPASIIKNPLGTIQTGIFLGLINGLFLFFIFIQLTYLFGGQQNISVEGYTYAEYARKGFFELICVAVFSYFIILSSEKSVEKKEQDHTVVFKILSSVLIVQVLIIMAAAFMRLSLYEEAYGFTQLRFYSHAFTIWLGVIFIFFLIKIFIKQQQSLYIFETFLTSLIFVGVINIMNPDAFIARKNIDRIGKTNVISLDNEYLQNLSDDAIPEILTLLESPDQSIWTTTVMNLQKIKDERAKNHEKYDQWQSWNLARNTATELLKTK